MLAVMGWALPPSSPQICICARWGWGWGWGQIPAYNANLLQYAGNNWAKARGYIFFVPSRPTIPQGLSSRATKQQQDVLGRPGSPGYNCGWSWCCSEPEWWPKWVASLMMRGPFPWPVWGSLWCEALCDSIHCIGLYIEFVCWEGWGVEVDQSSKVPHSGRNLGSNLHSAISLAGSIIFAWPYPICRVVWGSVKHHICGIAPNYYYYYW